MSPYRAADRYEPGTPPGAKPRAAAPAIPEQGTTHFVTVDAAGNVVSMTSTVESIFGSQLIANGYFLNNELTDFDNAPTKKDRKTVLWGRSVSVSVELGGGRIF